MSQLQPDPQTNNEDQGSQSPESTSTPTTSQNKPCKTFMDYIKESWWVILVIIAVLGGMIWWFCFRKKSGDVETADMVGGVDSASASGSANASGSQSSSNSSKAPKLKITKQILGN